MYYAINQIKRLKRHKEDIYSTLILTSGITKMTVRIKQHTDATQRQASRYCAGRSYRDHVMQPPTAL